MPSFIIYITISSILSLSGNTGKPVFYHGSREDNKIALTFDACPSSTNGGYDGQITTVLVDSGVPATFFLSGKWIKKHKAELKKISTLNNFELENHSYSHPHCTTIADDKMKTELIKTDSLIRIAAGSSPRFFRPPYAETNKRTKEIADSLGLVTVMYDIASGDPDTTFTKKRLIRNIVSNTKNGSVILMHVNGRGWHTAEALPEIIGSLRQKGFVFVKMSELFDECFAGTDSTITNQYIYP